MTVLNDMGSYTLTDQARGQLEGCGIALSELYRLVTQPVMKVPGQFPSEERLFGYGLTAMRRGHQILSVAIDGATAENWSDWAVERATFGDSDVLSADEIVRRDAEVLEARRREATPYVRQRRRRMEHPSKVTVTHVAPRPAHKSNVPPDVILPGTVFDKDLIDRIHPALRAEVLRQIDGDFSRLIIHSATKVTIKPIEE